MEITLEEGSLETRPIFRNLMQLYQYDVSEYDDALPDDEGRFPYPLLERYWIPEGIGAEGRIHLLVRVDGRPAGFVLINTIGKGRPDVDHHMAEFFIMRRWRRQGVGRTVATQVFRRYPGRWEVRQEAGNLPAQRFWRSVIGGFTGGRFEEVQYPDWDGPVQVFDAT
ncbi:MAG: GNAT family N-acetyltransferase [Mycobacterium leprae]